MTNSSGGGPSGGIGGSPAPAAPAVSAPVPAPKASAPTPAPVEARFQQPWQSIQAKPQTVMPAPSQALKADRDATHARGATYDTSPRPLDLPIGSPEQNSPANLPAIPSEQKSPAKNEPKKEEQNLAPQLSQESSLSQDQWRAIEEGTKSVPEGQREAARKAAIDAATSYNRKNPQPTEAKEQPRTAQKDLGAVLPDPPGGYEELGRGRTHPNWPTDKQQTKIKENTEKLFEDAAAIAPLPGEKPFEPGYSEYRNAYTQAIDETRAVNRHNNRNRAYEFTERRRDKITTETNRRQIEADRKAVSDAPAPLDIPIAMEPGAPPAPQQAPVYNKSPTWPTAEQKDNIRKRAAESGKQPTSQDYRNEIMTARAFNYTHGAQPAEQAPTPAAAPAPAEPKKATKPPPQSEAATPPDPSIFEWQWWKQGRWRPEKEVPQPNERVDVAHRSFVPHKARRPPRNETWLHWAAEKVIPGPLHKYEVAKVEAQQSHKKFPTFLSMIGVRYQPMAQPTNVPWRWTPFDHVRNRRSVQYNRGGQKIVSSPKVVEGHELAWSRIADQAKGYAAKGHRKAHGTSNPLAAPTPQPMPTVYPHALPAHPRAYKQTVVANIIGPRRASIFEPLEEQAQRAEIRTQTQQAQQTQQQTAPQAQAQTKRSTPSYAPQPTTPDNPLNDLFNDLAQQKQAAQAQAQSNKPVRPKGHAVNEATVTSEWLKHGDACHDQNCPRCCKYANRMKGSWDNKTGIDSRDAKFGDEWEVREHGSRLQMTGGHTNTLREIPKQQVRL
jgi:hypothetical protein